MKIAMIGQKGVPCLQGGIEKHVEELAPRLAAFGNEVFVYVRSFYTPKAMTGYRGVKLVHLPTIRTKHLEAITHTFLATTHALFQGYDIIHFHGVGPSLLAFLPRLLRSKTKIIITFHCIDRKHAKWGRLAKIALRLGEWSTNRFAHQTITVSKTLQQYCQEAYDQKTCYLPNGVAESMQPVSQKILNHYGLEPKKYLLSVSRLVSHKGAHYLIQAFNELAPKDMNLAIVGAPSYTEDYQRELERLVADNPRIKLLGLVRNGDLQSLYANAYLFVHPSETEGLPIVILEAAINKLAVLASDIPENLEVIEPVGFSFETKNVADLVKKLQWLLTDPARVQEAGEQLYQIAKVNYDWDKIAKDTNDLYQQVIAGQTAGNKILGWQKA